MTCLRRALHRAERIAGDIIGIASVPYTLWRLSRSGYVPRAGGRA